jgi:hypothetical protein
MQVGDARSELFPPSNRLNIAEYRGPSVEHRIRSWIKAIRQDSPLPSTAAEAAEPLGGDTLGTRPAGVWGHTDLAEAK